MFWGTMGYLQRERWKAWMCPEHLCTQSLPSAPWFSKWGSYPMPLPWLVITGTSYYVLWMSYLHLLILDNLPVISQDRMHPTDLCTLKFIDSKITKWLDIRLGIYHWWKMWENAIYSTSRCENKVSSMLWKGGNDLDLAWQWPTNSYPSIFTTSFWIWNPCWGMLWAKSVPLVIVFNAR